MTITTPELARAVAQAWARPLAAPLTAAALLLAPSAHAQWRFTPTLDVRQTYTDNVALERDGAERDQFITTIAPGLRLNHTGPRLVVNGRFEYDYYQMSDKNIAGTARNARYLSGNAKGKLIDDLLYFDAAANITQRAISSFGQQPSEFSTANRAEVKTWQVSPYLVHRFGTLASTELRYRHDSVDAGIGGFGKSVSDTASLNVSSGSHFNRVGWGLQLSDQKIDNELVNDSAIKTANAYVRYIATPRLSFTAGIGYDDFDYESTGGATRGQSWNAGFIWAPSGRTSLTASIGHRYFGPSRQLKALHRSRHTSWSITYDDLVSTTRNNFLQPTEISTASLLDGVFAAEYPDPVERARVIEAYILATGLPRSVANDVNFLSNRFSLQKQLRASAAFRQGRTGATFSVFHVRREALSVRETDSALFGNAIASFNDNVDQKGVAATWDYRLTPKTRLDLTTDIIRNASLSGDLHTRTSSVRFAARHQIRARMFGTVELRRINGAVLGGSTYTENAVSAILSMQL